jgi:hypothetical protein
MTILRQASENSESLLEQWEQMLSSIEELEQNPSKARQNIYEKDWCHISRRAALAVCGG